MIYEKKVLETFLKNQNQLFSEDVAASIEEADEFLDDCMAVVVKDFKELKEYFEENADITGMSKAEILDSPEVFALDDGRYLIVEG